jgi:LuxR family maltose regulon positive regulatory protein
MEPMSGDLQRAEELGLTASDQPIPQYEVEYLALARRLLGQPDGWPDGFRLLDRLLKLGEANGDTGSIIAALALKALGLASKGRQREALELLGRALKLGEGGVYIRTFIDEGRPMEALLRMAKKQGVAPAQYVEKLLSHFETRTGTAKQVNAIENAIEPLTARELEVLRLIVAGASNSRIAEILVVAIGTVKRHTNSVYGKLGVASRTQAVARAHELKLV